MNHKKWLIQHLKNQVQVRKPQRYQVPDLGFVFITDRLLESYRSILPDGLKDLAARDIAVNVSKYPGIHNLEIGQVEIMFGSFDCHAAINPNGEIFCDSVPWWGYE